MPVGDCQRAFAAAALLDGLILATADSGTLTDAGHLSLGPAHVLAAQRLTVCFDALDGDEEDLRRGPHRPLRLDLMHVATRTPIEIDEYQHFTTDRLRVLETYAEDIPLGFDRTEYIDLCRTHRLSSDRYRAVKQARGFRRAGGRRAQRAFFDAVRDIGLPVLGYRPVVRAAVLDGDGATAFRRIRSALRASLDAAAAT